MQSEPSQRTSLVTESEQSESKRDLWGIMTGANIEGSLTARDPIGQESTDLDLQGQMNIKRLQQQLRLSKKNEEVTKDKLAQAKKQVERTEKEFAQSRENYEQRIDQLKNEILILQRHYDQLENSISENDRMSQSNNESGKVNSDLLKIIDDYAKQSEQKQNEITHLFKKIDSGKNKLDQLKKERKEQDSRIQRMKGAMDNVKTFLKVLNTNFASSMKVMRKNWQSTREQCLLQQKSFGEEVEKIKKEFTHQILKFQQGQTKYSTQHQNEINRVKNESLQKDQIIKGLEQQLYQVRKDHDNDIKNLKQSLEENYKQRHQEYKSKYAKSQNDKSFTQDLLQNVDQEKKDLIKEMEVLKIKHTNELDKLNQQLLDSGKEIKKQEDSISLMRQKEQQLQERLETKESHHKEEMKVQQDKYSQLLNHINNLMQKNESDKSSLQTIYHKEVQASSQREAERVKELREILENKVKERDEDLLRLRQKIIDLEGTLLKQRELYDIILHEKKEVEKQKDIQNEQFSVAKEKHQSRENELKAIIQDLNQQILSKSDQIQEVKKQLAEQDQERREQSKQMSAQIEQTQQLKAIIQEKEDQEIMAVEREIQLKEDQEELQYKLRLLEQQLRAQDIQLEQLKKELIIRQASTDLKTIQINEQTEQFEQISRQLRAALEQKAILEGQIGEQLAKRNRYVITVQQEIQTEAYSSERKEHIQAHNVDIKSIQCELSPSNSQYAHQSVQFPPIHKRITPPFSPKFKEDEKEERVEDLKLQLSKINEEEEQRSTLQERGIPVGTAYGKQFQSFQGIGQEEDQYCAPKIEESEERTAQQKPIATADYAMRGMRPAVRGRGRGGPTMRPAFNSAFATPFNPQQNQDSQQQEGQRQQPPIQKQEETPQITIQQNTSYQEPEQEPRQETKQEIKQEPQVIKEDPKQIEEKKEIREPNIIKEEQEVKSEKKEEIKQEQKPIETQNQPQQQSLLDFRNNRFFGMINGFLNFLTRRKQAYTGRPATSMYYDKKKGRYVIDGEEDSDDDVPPPPPPKPNVLQKKEELAEQKKEEPATTSSSLIQPGFTGVLGARGRGRGRGRGTTTIQQSQPQPQQFLPLQTQLENVQEEVKEEIKDNQIDQTALYTTTLDISQMPNLLQKQEEDNEREQQWLDKFNLQQNKIHSLKDKIVHLQNELHQQRVENEQTIGSFESLCIDLKVKATDEIDDLTTDITILKANIRGLAQERAVADIKIQQMEHDQQYYEEDNQKLREDVRQLKLKQLEQEIEQQAAQFVQPEEDYYDRYVTLSIENETLSYQLLQNKIDIHLLQKQVDQKQNISEALVHDINSQLLQKDQELHLQTLELNQTNHKLRDLKQSQQKEIMIWQERLQKAQHEAEQQQAQERAQRMQDQRHFQQKENDLLQEIVTFEEAKKTLNEHIVYLQQEIRKRDELLETSEFGDSNFEFLDFNESHSIIGVNDDDVQQQQQEDENGGGPQQQQKKKQSKRRTYAQMVQHQIEESREIIKRQIEEIFRLKQAVQRSESSEAKVYEAIEDINDALSGGEEQSSLRMVEEKSIDELFPDIIARIFKFKRAYESELTDLRHENAMLKLKEEECESYKFDIDMIQDEKFTLQQEMDRIQQENDQIKASVSNEVSSLQQQLVQQREQWEEEKAANQEEYKERLEKMSDQFKVKYEERLQSLQETLQEKQQANNDKWKQWQQQQQDQTKELVNEINELKEQIKMKELQIEEAENNNQTQQQSHQQEIIHLEQLLRQVQSQWDENRATTNAQIEQMTQDFQEIASILKKKNDQKKKKIKELTGQLKKLLQEIKEIKQQENSEDKIKQAVSIEREELRQQFEQQEQQWISQINQFRQQLTEQESQEGQWVGQINELRKQLEAQVMKAQLVDQQYNEAQEQVYKLRNELQTKSKEYEDNILRTSTLSSEAQEEVKAHLETQLQAKYDASIEQMNEQFELEKASLRQEYEEREEEFKQQAVELAKNFKERLEKERQRAKSAQEKLKQIQEDSQKQLKDFREQYENLKSTQQEQSSSNEKIKALEDMMKAEKDKANGLIKEKEIQVQELIKKLQQYEQEKIDMLKEIMHLIDSNMQKEDEDIDWGVLVEKLREFIHNYEEDKRQFQLIVEERDNFSLQLSQIIQEKSAIEHEKSLLQDKLDHSVNIHLQKKVAQLEEEREEMRKDFYIKICNYDQEMSILQEKFKRQMGQEDEPSQIDSSMNSVVRDYIEEKEKQGQQKQQQQPQPKQGGGGLFGSIASYFLTETELNDYEEEDQ